MFCRRSLLAFATLLPLASLTLSARAEEPAKKIAVLIIDGQNNHNWKVMTPPMKAELERTGLFSVDVATTPSKADDQAGWAKFRPDFSKYRVVLSNYNGSLWPEEVRNAFVEWVRAGGGVVIIHAANNSFEGWPAYNDMIGLGWRNNGFGPGMYLDDAGKKVMVEKGKGRGAGHGAQHEFQITVRDEAHPVMAGMPKLWMHAKDELYHGQRGPTENMVVLATAYSKDTKVHEPMIWWVPFGKGKVFTNVMGHTGGAGDPAIKCVGFLAVMNRACEWVATGKVTQKLPENFPTEKEVKIAAEKKSEKK